MKISACWIVKNEEKNIARSIDSVKTVCDEMIVVDTGSVDDTVNVAEKAGARVERFDWIHDFSAAKNKALSHATGDIVIFLDADEWFSPALTSADKAEMEQLFKKNPKLYILQLKIHNLNSQGNVKTVSACDRILKNSRNIAFYKPIHEVLRLKDGSTPKSMIIDKWPIWHSGYTEDILDEKMNRNIEMLEHVIKGSGSAEEKHMQHCYLVREYFNRGQKDDCLRHLRVALDEPDLIKRQIRHYQAGIVPLLYCMLIAGYEMRGEVSRLELYHKVVGPFKKYLDGYRGTATIELYYNALFGFREDLLLEGLSGAVQKSERMAKTPVLYYKDAEAVLYMHAAEASLRRGKQAQAMDYAMAALDGQQNLPPAVLRILLRCLKGQTAHDIIVFLNSQFDATNPHVLNQLVQSTRMDGFGEVHAYYLNKKIETEIATKGDYLSLLLLYGKSAEAAKAAADFYMQGNQDLATSSIFLSAVCAKSKDLYLEYQELLAPVSDIMEAYFSGERLQTVTEKSAAVLYENFENIAFLAGFERACDFLRVFSADALMVYRLKADYCVRNGFYAALLEDRIPDPSDYACNRYAAECLFMLNRYTEAVGELTRMFELGYADKTLLQLALAIYDKTGDAHAKQLHDAYLPACERLTDLNDIIRTGYVPQKYLKDPGGAPGAAHVNGLETAEVKVLEMIQSKK